MPDESDIKKLQQERDDTLSEVQEIEEKLSQATLTLDTLEATTKNDQLPVCPHCDEHLPGDAEKIVAIAERRVNRLEERLQQLRSKKEKLEEYIDSE